MILYEEMGRYEEARGELNRILDRSRHDSADPEAARKFANYHLARISLRKEDWRQAAVHFSLGDNVNGRRRIGRQEHRAFPNGTRALRAHDVPQTIDHYGAQPAAHRTPRCWRMFTRREHGLLNQVLGILTPGHQLLRQPAEPAGLTKQGIEFLGCGHLSNRHGAIPRSDAMSGGFPCRSPNGVPPLRG